MKRRLDVGMELEDIKELASELWTMHDGYVTEEKQMDLDLGEDE